MAQLKINVGPILVRATKTGHPTEEFQCKTSDEAHALMKRLVASGYYHHVAHGSVIEEKTINHGILRAS